MKVLRGISWRGLTKTCERVTCLIPRRAVNLSLSTSDSELEETFPLETFMGGSSMVFRGVDYSEAEKYVSYFWISVDSLIGCSKSPKLIAFSRICMIVVGLGDSTIVFDWWFGDEVCFEDGLSEVLSEGVNDKWFKMEESKQSSKLESK